MQLTAWIFIVQSLVAFRLIYFISKFFAFRESDKIIFQ